MIKPIDPKSMNQTAASKPAVEKPALDRRALDRRVALVTGGIGGLGSEICRQLALAGREVVAVDLAARSERAAAFHEEVASFGSSIRFEPADVSDFDSCQKLIARIEQQHGGVDILVNAAGITRDASLRKMSPQQWHELMRVNLDGVFNMCRNVVDGMTERGFGRIVNISSVNGQTGQFGQTNYSAAKAGVHGFSMALARETARKGVTVNTVSPGYCDTPMVAAVSAEIRAQIIADIPVGRLGAPADIARAVKFLAADDAGYITGANLPVNGGYFMSF
jgi:acetoacetyl-CoA reductase